MRLEAIGENDAGELFVQLGEHGVFGQSRNVGRPRCGRAIALGFVEDAVDRFDQRVRDLQIERGLRARHTATDRAGAETQAAFEKDVGPGVLRRLPFRPADIAIVADQLFQRVDLRHADGARDIVIFRQAAQTGDAVFHAAQRAQHDAIGGVSDRAGDCCTHAADRRTADRALAQPAQNRRSQPPLSSPAPACFLPACRLHPVLFACSAG